MVPSGIHAQSISIAKYADNRKAAISFTFDDGLKEQYSILFPKMKELGIKGTFCLIGSRMNQQPPKPRKADLHLGRDKRNGAGWTGDDESWIRTQERIKTDPG